MSEKTNEVIRCLRNYDCAKTAHDEAMSKCDSSWGYRGYSYIEALEKAGDDFGDALEALIDERIDARETRYSK